MDYVVGAVTSSLHHCLKYIMNGMLITFKAEEIIFMIKNVVVHFIKSEDYKDRNIHAFKDVEWVPKSIVLRRLKISKATRMAANCFRKHEIPF
jgi:hypothetical protein